MPTETFEGKLLAIFARFRGQEVTSQTLFEMEKACEKEVWAHLPKRIRDSWSLKLEFSTEVPGRIDLRPRKHGDVRPEELEAALREPFVDRSNSLGGIANFDFGFSGDVSVPASGASVTSSSEARPSEPIHVGFSAPGEVPASAERASLGEPVSARDIVTHAQALGIQLPPNSSLLQPFLDALARAIEYKERAERAEAKLAELQKLL